MHQIFRKFSWASLVVFQGSLATGVEVPIPSGDFESGRGNWEEIFGGGSTIYEYPANGGNPGGYGVMENVGGYGIWVSNFNQPFLLSELGLVAGEVYSFRMDMRILSGSNLGGFKIDFFSQGNAAGSTGDLFPAVIGDGSSWSTYDFEVAVPNGVDGIKVVPLWGPNSRVAYDNIRVETTPVVVPDQIPDADFSAPDGALWEQTSGGGTFVFEFPGSGGNVGGYAVIDHSANDGGFGVLVSNGGTALQLSQLGLTAGETYRFGLDMRLISGSRIGGLKVDFFSGAEAAGSTGDLFPPVIGSGATWETYEFEVTLPPSATAIKVVGLWGAGSIVGYDNFFFDPTPLVVAPISEIPNRDFEAGLQGWSVAGEPDTQFAASADGGNPGGYVTMTNSGTGFGVLVSNGGAPLPLAGLGLEAGRTYRFRQDMRLLSGDRIGGLKVEFYNGPGAAGDTGDLYPQIIGDGSTWETYEFEVTIPPAVNGIKIVPLWGSGSVVGFDNVVTPGALTNGFERWISGFPGVGDLTGYNDDPDGDGQPNGMENFLGTDPSVPSHGLTILDRRLTESGDFLFSHPINLMPVPEASSGRYLWSTDLVHFYEDGEAAPDGTAFAFDTSPGIPTTGLTRVIRVASIGRDASQRVFVQLRVTGATEGK